MTNKKNLFERGGEIGVGIIRFVTTKPVEFGLSKGAGRRIRFGLKRGEVRTIRGRR